MLIRARNIRQHSPYAVPICGWKPKVEYVAGIEITSSWDVAEGFMGLGFASNDAWHESIGAESRVRDIRWYRDRYNVSRTRIDYIPTSAALRRAGDDHRIVGTSFVGLVPDPVGILRWWGAQRVGNAARSLRWNLHGDQTCAAPSLLAHNDGFKRSQSRYALV